LTANDADGANMKNVLQIWDARNLQKLTAALAQIEVLKAAAADNTVLDAAISAKNVAEAELQKIKANLDTVLAEETKKIRQSVNNETGALASREVTVKRKEDVLKVSTDAQLTLRAFDYLGALIKRMPSWEPKDFFDPTIPKSPWIWRIFFDEQKAKNWCAWEVEISAKPREQQTSLIEYELHCRSCVQHQYEKIDTSPERKEFLEARARQMQIECQVYEIGKQMTSQCMLKPHPMPSQVDLEAGNRANQRARILNGDIPTGGLDNIAPPWITGSGRSYEREIGD